MPDTLVIQSHRQPLPMQWLQPCIDSVRAWAELNHYDYQFVGDELFDCLPPALLQKTAQQRVIATDLARLLMLQAGLRHGYQAVIWCDADFLIFDPHRFVIPDDPYALGREVWVQADAANKLRVYKKVHNAFMLFRRANSFLDFYADTAQRLLTINTAGMPPQFIGPKLLTALHNVVSCPVAESAGMLSPVVIKDLLAGGGLALDLFRQKSPAPVYGANLSSSLSERDGLTETKMNRVINDLLESGIVNESA